MDIQEINVASCRSRDAHSCVENIVEMTDAEEEVLVISSSTDAAFDSVIGCIEDIIMEEEFQQLQQTFMEKYYQEFDDSDENKLSYTPIFKEYVDLLEKHLERQLVERIPGFHMNTFIELLMRHKEETDGDIFDMLLTFTDFMAFKEMFLEYRAEKEGRGLDDNGLLVTPLNSADFKHNKPQ
ncbi:ADP-ribosylation factor-like protein 2-binding protein [Cynoglossus semilaevis]|uniref:ADP-ribosylation factor-like protein 2-binding protein n=1 Tax=Cynoglossus semilaevis TaxID=244447 RepID=A0A3P8X668_CYNSE|nr:ADP-ribosylation factor-like protein 2-binding protein [Cynoglossus semilaevis]